MGLKRILETYTEYKEEVYHAKYTALMAEQEEQQEIKTGLLRAVDVIDLIIEILRGAKNTKDAKDCLMFGKTENIRFRFKGSEADAKELRFTEKQTDAILAMRLQKLIGLEIDQLKKELEETERLLKKYRKLLSSAKEMKKQMIADIEDLKKRYAIPRKTVIRDLGEVEVKKEVEEEVDYVVLLDRFFYLKAVPKPIFEKNKDIPYKLAVECTNLDRLAVFDSDGQMHTLKVAELIKKQMKKDKKFRISDKGIQIFEFCQMQENADVLSVLTEKQLAEGEMIIAAADGKGKRVAGSAFPTSRKTSQASKKPLIFAAPAEQFLVIVSEAGNVLKIRTADIPEQGKGAGGVTLISLKKGDSIRMMETGGKDAVTEVQVLERFESEEYGPHTLVEVVLHTGRTHQIRVHLSHIGHVIAGDELYGGSTGLIGRQALHAYHIEFTHPATGEYMTFETELPEDIRHAIDALR